MSWVRLRSVALSGPAPGPWRIDGKFIRGAGLTQVNRHGHRVPVLVSAQVCLLNQRLAVIEERLDRIGDPPGSAWQPGLPTRRSGQDPDPNAARRRRSLTPSQSAPRGGRSITIRSAPTASIARNVA